ncbi:MAG TPA: histidine kinase dimerization/phospho-acceptor domain-containing protein [Gammaproteobacteria bacterium]|nr:histidine kinase dimerization/phospho-acceptor domain-containing protein [Gammaproteobacteria bacterium]
MHKSKITAKKVSKTSRRTSPDRLEQKNFAAQISHGLRTPLNAIIGFAEIIKDKRAGVVSPKQHEYLGDIIISAKHLLLSLNNILKHIEKMPVAKSKKTKAQNKKIRIDINLRKSKKKYKGKAYAK